MNFATVQDLRANSAKVWKKLAEDGEIVITSNGTPVALMIPATGESLEKEIKAVKRARAELALQQLQKTAAKKGLDTLSGEEIEREITAVRSKKRNNS